MPVLGADPDAPERPFPEYIPKVFASKPVNALTNHFAYHKNMSMSQRFNEQDRAIMNRFFSGALNRGYSESTLINMIDVFWQTWGGEAQQPALAFVSKDMQNKLTADRDVEVTDPWLVWLNEGMPDTVPLAAELRKAVLLGGQGLELRYPDVVADIIRRDGDPLWTRAALSFVRDVVRWHLGELDSRPSQAVAIEHRLNLPDELTGVNRAPSKIRDMQDTVKQAIARIPVGRK